jgi:hypothetical protein
MDIFFGSTANFVNNIQQANTAQERNTSPSQQPQPTQGSTVDYSGKDAPKKSNHSGGLDSLGRGNLV